MKDKLIALMENQNFVKNPFDSYIFVPVFLWDMVSKKSLFLYKKDSNNVIEYPEIIYISNKKLSGRFNFFESNGIGEENG